ncbi:MAG TPA: hypothetical protein VFF76_11420 [Holophagaceae bacterium]|jgi:hypothetical protein|nr:hypothetical protein [Holophagaceae bacterium]
MPVVGRAGHHLLTEVLAEDPFGTLYRGIALRDGRFYRHLLVRVFSRELRAAGLASRFPAAQAGLVKLGPLKAYERYQLEGGEAPFSTSPHIAGRSLAALLRKIAAGAAPMPLDSGLALIWSLSQEVAKLRGQGFHHGLLSPHTVWVGFDGQVQVLDAPLAGAFQELLPAAPGLQSALRPYDPPAGLDEAQRDLWQLGALAYELLTRNPLPPDVDGRQSARREVVEHAASGNAEGRDPLAGELKRMLHRMLGTEGGFASIEAFNRDMERALFDGEHVPTTFGLAFYMHDIFLQEANADLAALKAEKEEDFFVHTDAAKRLQNRIENNLAILAEAPVERPRRRRIGAVLVASAAVLAAGVGFLTFRSGRETQIDALKAQVVASERRAAELSIQQSDLSHHDQEEKDHRARVQQQLSEAKDTAVQAELQRQLDEARKRQAALEQQQAKLEAEQRKLADARQAYERKAAVVPEASAVRAVSPAPLPAQDTPPRLMGQLTAGYPPGFHGLGEMRVRVRVFVSEQGRAQKAMVMDGDPALADMAKQAALAGTYSPALRAGAPTRDWVTVTIPFVR